MPTDYLLDVVFVDIPVIMSQEDYDKNLSLLKDMKQQFAQHQECCSYSSAPWWFAQGVLNRFDSLIAYLEEREERNELCGL